MIHKFQNIHGISYTIYGNIKDIKSEIQDMILQIMEDKKFPFTDVYVKLPTFLFHKFMDELRNTDLKNKEMEARKDFFLIKF
jgi:hypothetical protein